MTVWEHTGDHVGADVAARRRAGKALRDLGHALIGRDATTEVLEDLAGNLEQLTAVLAAGEPRSRSMDGFAERTPPDMPAGVSIESYDDRPFSGQASPWGLDLQVRRRGNTVEADLVLRSAHEGAPGRSHGGIVAGLFDDVFGFVLGMLHEAAFTGELTVRYEQPTPLHRRLLCRGRLDRRAGRKLWITGELVDPAAAGDAVVARATGLFIVVDATMLAAMTQQLPPPDESSAFPA